MSSQLKTEKKYTHTKQRGGQESWDAWIEGRDWMDVYRVVMTDHKLRSYKLDNVCSELLGTKKIHIAYDDIPKYQMSFFYITDIFFICQLSLSYGLFVLVNDVE